MRTLPSLLTVGLLLFLTPVCLAEDANPPPETGSGTEAVWTARAARAENFRSQMNAFALQRSAAWGKWQLSRNKLTSHLDRCHTEIRSSNRDTLLPVTQQCIKGQLIIERDALKRDRAILEQLPGLTEPVRTTILQKSDALVAALQTVIDGVDARVFSTMAQLKDVRANLLTQYRQPYWLAMTQARADEALTWVASLLIALRDLPTEGLSPDTTAKTAEAMVCLEGAEAALTPVLTAESSEEAHAALAAGISAARSCNALILEAQALQNAVPEAQE